MNNSIRFFSKMFGEYPYPLFRGVYHPFNFGQGFPTTIMIPNADAGGFGADYHTFSFIAHETSHQWWGDMVLWRSYRDQWLSEGFAQYSGMLYVQLRDKTHSEKELIEHSRKQLTMPPPHAYRDRKRQIGRRRAPCHGLSSGKPRDARRLLRAHL
jgi:hypothetical protein